MARLNTIKVLRGTAAQIAAAELAHGEPAISTDTDVVSVGTAASKITLEKTLDSDQKRKITLSTSDASDGADGDVWLKHVS